jgi:hypothetical protein
MEQPIFGGNIGALNNTNVTRYSTVYGGYTSWTQYIVNGGHVVSTSGKIKGLYVELDAAAGAGADDTYTFALIYDGTPTALTCAIVQGATSGSDLSHEIDVVAGKIIALRCISSGTPSNTPHAQWSMMFSGTNAKESLMGSMFYTLATTNAPIYSGDDDVSVTESYVRQVIPTSGTIKNLYIDETIGTGTGTWTVAINKNSIAQALSVAVTVAAPTNNDLVNSFAVVAGDTVSMTCTVSGSITGAGILRVGMTFVADTDGESIILGGGNAYIGLDANTKYNPLLTMASGTQWTTTEGLAQQLSQICVLKNLYVLLDGTPYQNSHSADVYDFTVETNTNTASTITCQVTSDATTASDVFSVTGHSVTLAAGDNICLKCVPTSSPTARHCYWGLVCYIASGTAYTQACAGVLSAAMVTGRIVYQVNTNIGGSVTSAGTLQGMWLVALSGAVTSVGAIAYQIGVNVGGAITTAGHIGYAIGTYVGGIVNSTGSLMKNVAYVLSVGGAVTLTGTLEVLDVILQAVGGVLSAVGEMSIRKVRTIARKIRTRVYRAIGLKSRW